MQNFLWTIELVIFKFINQTLSFDWLDKITPILTDLDQEPWFKFIIPALLIFFFLKKFKRTGITYFLFLILSVSTSDFIGGKVKKIFLRPRPFQVLETSAIQKSPAKENRSFYSNHSSNMFTSASYIAVFFPAAKIAVFTIASTVALTRVHTGVHYPSDITVGALMGLLWGFLFSYLAKLAVKKTESLSSKHKKPT